jgi:hypothetical protein
LNLITTFSSGAKDPADARAAVASCGRSERMAEAVMVRGSSGESGRDESGSGIGDGDGEVDDPSGNSMAAVTGLIFWVNDEVPDADC